MSPPRRLLLHLRWLALLIVVACLDTFAPAGAVPFVPPASYRAWWAAIEDCARLWGDYGRLRWYEVPGDDYPCPAYDGRCDGWWQPPHTIYLAERYLADRQLVEHEMLHDLLQRGDHPPVFQVCGVAGTPAPLDRRVPLKAEGVRSTPAGGAPSHITPRRPPL